ncbi:MAG: transporter substrate-binding domain-containing protein [Acidiferrobacterales bacterium]|nr:transporter substrate-binding domain-containing protein [Acidiferrobacterales bacterium]
MPRSVWVAAVGPWVQGVILLLGMFTHSLYADDDCNLVVGWEPWHPYQYIDDSGELTGFDIEVLAAIAELTQCTFDFKQINWARGIVEVESGILDVLMAANITPERSQWAYFSDHYLSSTVVLFVRPGESSQYPFKSMRDIANFDFRLGVGRGVIYNDEFAELIKVPEFEKRLVYIPTAEMQQYQMLQTQRVDGYLRSITTLGSLPEVLGSDLKLEIHPLPVQSSRLHIMFSKNSVNEETVMRINNGLRSLREDGTLDSFLKKYF